MDRIIELINNGEYLKAAEGLAEYVSENALDYMFYLLSATVNLQFGMYDEAGENAARGLRLSPENYELYMLLGDALESSNKEQAYLCYEQAMYWAKEHQANEMDMHFLQEKLSVLQSISKVSPLSIVTIDSEEKDMTVQVNKAINEEGKGHDVFIVPNHARYSPNSVFTLRMGLYSAEDVALVACMSNAGYSYRRIRKGKAGFDWEEYSTLINVPNEDCLEDRIYIKGFPVMIKEKILREIGLYDESMSLSDYAFNDYGIRILAHGYRSVLCHNSFIYLDPDIETTETPKADEYIFRRKWGFAPEYYGNARGDLIPFIKAEKRAEIEVLEVGCGIGATLERIRFLFPKARVHGVEIVDLVAAVSPKCLCIKCGNIESEDPDVRRNSLDYIIFGDVLEHLHNPTAVLIRMRECLKPDGHIIVSLPNLMNATVIRKLLMGYFTYEDSGILDRTHLQFFTYIEARRMFEVAGYEVEDEAVMVVRDESTEGEENKSFFDKLLPVEGVAQKQMFDAFQMHFLLRMKY